jgi:hypothetical protein
MHEGGLATGCGDRSDTGTSRAPTTLRDGASSKPSPEAAADWPTVASLATAFGTLGLRGTACICEAMCEGCGYYQTSIEFAPTVRLLLDGTSR